MEMIAIIPLRFIDRTLKLRLAEKKEKLLSDHWFSPSISHHWMLDKQSYQKQTERNREQKKNYQTLIVSTMNEE